MRGHVRPPRARRLAADDPAATRGTMKAPLSAFARRGIFVRAGPVSVNQHPPSRRAPAAWPVTMGREPGMRRPCSSVRRGMVRCGLRARAPGRPRSDVLGQAVRLHATGRGRTRAQFCIRSMQNGAFLSLHLPCAGTFNLFGEKHLRRSVAPGSMIALAVAHALRGGWHASANLAGTWPLGFGCDPARAQRLERAAAAGLEPRAHTGVRLDERVPTPLTAARGSRTCARIRPRAAEPSRPTPAPPAGRLSSTATATALPGREPAPHAETIAGRKFIPRSLSHRPSRMEHHARHTPTD